MNIDIKNYPVAILFSGNIYDFRGLQFFTVLNKERINQLSSLTTKLIKLDANEKDLFCIENNGEFFLKFSFLKFIIDSSEYIKQFNNISDTSDPILKEIYYYLHIYSDEDEESADLKVLKNNCLKINGIDNSNYESIKYLKLDINEIEKIFKSFNLEEIQGYENENNLLIKFNFKKNFSTKIPGYDIDSDFIPILYKDGLEIIKYLKIKSKFSDGSESSLFEINDVNKFNIKSKKVNYFTNNFDILGHIFNISNLILDRYNYFNFINFGDQHNYDGNELFFLEKESFLWKSIVEEDNYEKGFIASRKVYALIKIIKQDSKYIIEVDLLKEIDILDKSINILENNFTNDKIIEIINKQIQILDSKITNKLNDFINNSLKSEIEKVKNNLKLIKDYNEKKIIESIKKFINLLKKNFITNLYLYANYDRIIINYNGMNFNSSNLIIKDNKIQIDYVDITDNILNESIIVTLNFIKINSHKCFNLGLNLSNSNCSLVIPEILLEKGYGNITKDFFRNDNNFKIYDIFNFSTRVFKPDPNLILILLNKLNFKKKKIIIYNIKLVIIQDYNSWKSSQNIDKSLNNNKYLGIYLQNCILYINLNLNILNPKYKDFEYLTEKLENNSLYDEFKREKPLNEFLIKNYVETAEKKVFEKYLLKCKIDISKDYLPILQGGYRKEDYGSFLIKKLLIKSNRLIKNKKKFSILQSKFEIINNLKILNNS